MPGKILYINVFPDCRIEQDSPVYRHILAEKASVSDPTPLENASPARWGCVAPALTPDGVSASET